MGKLVRIGAALCMLGVVCGCSALPAPRSVAAGAPELDDLLAVVPGEARVLMGMGSTDHAEVMATAELGDYRATRLTVVAVCQGEGELQLSLDHGGAVAFPCDKNIATVDIPVTSGARPSKVSIVLDPGNTYSTLVYAADPPQ
ncbi:hypothetical protein [Paeniglutamicibacter sulfureus]|uniref:Lipoprotein n=1 Tax=Paeniglutamicibacter sulfureus TaxID=43666 RepID=A0ABU2BI70_9MICC|nr:hypothetical protein [Paeniglutamicibacter sulfureus]MDR7358293.1 hypothetical protein [Paeniglutamicibacter sulfureus]